MTCIIFNGCLPQHAPVSKFMSGYLYINLTKTIDKSMSYHRSTVINVFAARICNAPYTFFFWSTSTLKMFCVSCSSVLDFENMDITLILLKVKCCNIPKNFSLIIGSMPYLNILKLRYLNTNWMFHGNLNECYHTLQ